jgi:hypothetical protein
MHAERMDNIIHACYMLGGMVFCQYGARIFMYDRLIALHSISFAWSYHINDCSAIPLSHINLGIWGNAYETTIKPLKLLLCKALKLIYNIDYYTSSTLVYKISRLLNIENLNFKNLCLFIYKVQNR